MQYGLPQRYANDVYATAPYSFFVEAGTDRHAARAVPKAGLRGAKTELQRGRPEFQADASAPAKKARGRYAREMDAALPPLSVVPVLRRWVRTYGDAYAVPA